MEQSEKHHVSLYKLKEKEFKENSVCNCKAKYCKVNHHKSRWIASKAGKFFTELTMICPDANAEVNDSTGLSEEYISLVCDSQLLNYESLKNHTNKNHKAGVYSCHICDKKFHSEANMNHHIRKVHGLTFRGVYPALINLLLKSIK